MTKSISKSLMGASSTLIILLILRQKKSYGYEINKTISEASDNRINWQAGSLYPMLKKLEEQKLIKSEWIIEDNARARKYYSILDKGLKKIEELHDEWQFMCTIHNKLLINAGVEPIPM